MYSVPQNQDTNSAITPFELKALAFADLILSEVDDSDFTPNSINPPETNDLPAYKTIRCICGDNQPTNRELFSCPNCHCFLHKDCLDPVDINNPNFKCQFCRLMLDGIDPFRDLKTWIGNVDSELRAIHNLVVNTSNYENQQYSSGLGNEYPYQNMRNRQSGNMNVRNQLKVNYNEIIQRLTNITRL